MAAITENEAKILLEFRKRIADMELRKIQEHDMFLITWLRAREYNLKKAEEMFRKSQEWRKVNDIVNLFKNWIPPEEYVSKFSFKFCGYDTDASPVIFVRVGRWDVRKVIEAGERDLYLKYLQYIGSTILHQVEEMIYAKDKFISQFIVIMDMQGYLFRQLASIPTVETHLEAVREFESNYPETLKACYIININKLFSTIFNIVKPLLHARTISKIHACDSNVEKWKAYLQKNIPTIDMKILCGELNGDMEITVIQPGQKRTFDFDITQNSTTLSWDFLTENHDIGFGIIFHSVNLNNEGEVEILASDRKVGGKQHTNSILCTNLGKCQAMLCNRFGMEVDYFDFTDTIVFDNSYSRMRSKTLHYKFTTDLTT